MRVNARIIFGVISLFLAARLFPCENEALEEAEFALLEIIRSVPLFAEREAEVPRMDFTFNLLEAGGLEADIEFFNGFLYGGNSAAQYAEIVIDNFTPRYLEMRGEASLYYPYAVTFNWMYAETMCFNKFKQQAMVIERELYSYTGGAHGMPAKIYYTIDLEARKVMSLEDFFRDPEGAELRNIVMEELRLYSGIQGSRVIEEGQPLTQGIYLTDAPPLSGNFFISDEGLTLHWDVYDIAPYAYGGIEIVLPWRKIRPLLRHDAMEFLEKCGIYMFM